MVAAARVRETIERMGVVETGRKPIFTRAFAYEQGYRFVAR